MEYSVRDHRGTVQKLVVSPQEYMVDDGGWAASTCLPAVVSMGDVAKRPIMILGEVFMRHYFTVFHWGAGRSGRGARVGFAPARYDNESEAFFLEVAAGAKSAD